MRHASRLAALALPLLLAPTARAEETAREVTILYTNDFHTALDPIPAYWLPGSPRLGGAAQLASLVESIRARDETVFLFDAGDMFTGMLSFLTRGEALMEMMAAMRYDAFGIGNHEFDYGAASFEPLMWRAPYPVLGANIFYKGTHHRYSRPHAILERNGVRLGVVGVIGHDARSVALPSGITELEFSDPSEAVAASIAELRPRVDLIVVLAHQGKTGPMQTDAEGVLDALPFVNSLVTLELSGAELREVLEQGLSLERGLIQVSGLRAVYDLERPVGRRLLEAAVGGAPLRDDRRYKVATNSFLAQGGDLYATFLHAKTLAETDTLLSELVIEHLRSAKRVAAPSMGRLVPVSRAGP